MSEKVTTREAIAYKKKLKKNYCTDYTYLALGLGTVGLVLWGAGRVMMLNIRNQAAKAKQL